jgi:hypothetical protein
MNKTFSNLAGAWMAVVSVIALATPAIASCHGHKTDANHWTLGSWSISEWAEMAAEAEAGQTAHVSLKVDPRSLGQVDAKGNRVVVPGEYVVSLGGTQPGESASIQTAKFTVTGKAELPK